MVYVGTLYAYQCEDGEPEPCERVPIGVDADLGLVQASCRAELAAGDYTEPPPGARGRKCIRLWYERRRADYPDDRFWFHDLADSVVFVAPVDKQLRNPDRGKEAAPRAIIQGPDVETCPEPPGDFLCG
tara:strand:+ start:71 stop:457 length:387 start_codon:yes stop_codon:yes gene_type:complete